MVLQTVLDGMMGQRRFFRRADQAKSTSEAFVNRRYLLLVTLVLGSSCQKEPHRIGVWTGSTGSNVAKMVEHDTNFKGGVAGRRLQVRLVYQRALNRDSLTPHMLGLSLDSMANDPSVLAVVTRMTDSVTERAAQAFEKQGLPYLITTPVDESYAGSHPHALLLSPSVQREAEFLVDQSLLGGARKSVAILHVRQPEAEMQVEAIKAALSKRGITPTLTLSFSPDADEYNMTAKAHEIASAKPDILYFVGRSPSLLMVHSVIRNRLPDVQLYGTSLVESWHVYENPQRIYTGLHFVRFANPMAPDSAMAGLRDRMVMWVGRNELNTEEIIALDAERAIAAAMRDSAVTRAQMLEHLRTTSYDGLIGPVKFDANRRVDRTLYLAEVSNDSVRTVARSDSAAAVRR